ncbi:MAG: hypothetical protein NTX22_09500 [Ignavibacteriales bacterium]|nr:hypothetical protein [Ignavibacteriales bacterium]
MAITKLYEALKECNTHIKRLSSAVKDLKTTIPLNAEKYNSLSETDIRTLDQFIYRFFKLQDAMGERLFSAVLLMLAEDINKMSFLDILNRLEQLHLLESKDSWLYLRKLRNEFLHEYSNSFDDNITAINQLYYKLQDIYNIFINIKNLVINKFENELKPYIEELETPTLF